jgi:hypothetical protein
VVNAPSPRPSLTPATRSAVDCFTVIKPCAGRHIADFRSAQGSSLTESNNTDATRLGEHLAEFGEHAGQPLAEPRVRQREGTSAVMARTALVVR